MKKMNKNSRTPLLLLHEKIFAVALALLMMTLISFHMVSRLYARYTFSDHSANAARAASAGFASVKESKAVYSASTGEYTLDTNVVTESNIYSHIVPGMTIPKDTWVRTSGSNEVAYDLYIEVTASTSGIFTYYIDNDIWSPSNNYSAQHGGIIYKYSDYIRPNQAKTIDVFDAGNNKEYIFVSPDLKDKLDIDLNSGNHYIRVYAYMVQRD